MSGPLGGARAVTKIPAQDLERARRFYRDRLGLEPAERRQGGLRYVLGETEFHVFASSGSASGTSTQMGLEVDDLDSVVRDLQARGLRFERFDLPGSTDGGDHGVEQDVKIVDAPDNYPSKGRGERGVFFLDSEGNVIGLGQAVP